MTARPRSIATQVVKSTRPSRRAKYCLNAPPARGFRPYAQCVMKPLMVMKKLTATLDRLTT